MSTIDKLLERAGHEGTPAAEAAACREKVKALRQKSKALMVQPVSPEDLEEADLGELAVIANKFHDEVEAAGTSMLVAAWSAGHTLRTAKERCEHGEWLPWLDANFHGSKRTAQVYMQIAENTQSAAHLDSALSIRAALDAITKNPEQPSYQPKGKRSKAAITARQMFVKRYMALADDISFVIDAIEKNGEFAGAACEHLEGLVEQRDLLTKLIRELRRVCRV